MYNAIDQISERYKRLDYRMFVAIDKNLILRK